MQSLVSSLFSSSRTRLLAALSLAALLGAVAPAFGAETLAANLQGKYALKTATLSISPLISKQDLPIPPGVGNTTIGASGLAGLKEGVLQKIFKDAGLGSVLKAKITQSTATSQKGTITGTLKGAGYSTQLSNGSYNAILGKSGWTIAGVGKGKLPVVGGSYSVAFTLVLKKQ